MTVGEAVEAPPAEHFPRLAILPKVGRVRVLEYVGDGLFRVLGPGDQVWRVHRDRLTFIKNS